MNILAQLGHGAPLCQHPHGYGFLEIYVPKYHKFQSFDTPLNPLVVFYMKG